MKETTLQDSQRQQKELKNRASGVISSLEAQEHTLFGFDGALDPLEDKISKWELARKISRLKECSSFIEWRNYDRTWELHNANFCRQPDGCPICAKRLQKNRVRRFKDPITEAAKKFKYVYFITATIKNEINLRVALAKLKNGMERFRRQGQKRLLRNDSRGEWGKVEAGFVSIEIKRGKDSKLWHPHAHGLVFTDKRIDFRADKETMFQGKKVRASKLSMDWNRATLGESINIDCRPIFGKMLERKGKKYFADIWTQSLEILKYNTKILDGNGKANALDVATILCAGYSKRKFNTYGEFRDPSSELYCGPLEPYVSEVPEGFTGKPKIFTQHWIKSDNNYSKLLEHKLPQIEEMKKCEWRTIAGKIMGRFKARKYRILRVRRFFSQRDRMDEFDKALEMNEKIKLSFLRDERESHYNSGNTTAETMAIFNRSFNRMKYFFTHKQFFEDWYQGVPDENLPRGTSYLIKS